MSSSAPHLPLHRIALCLDCETCFEIGAASCPACGSDTWVLMTKFLNQGPLRTLSQFQPLPNSLAKAPKHRDEPSLPVVKQLLIVARDRQKLYENVKRAFSDNPTVEVILDRRSAEPRYDGRGKPERRRGGDLQRIQTDHHLRALGWAIVRLDVFRTAAGQPHRSESR